MQNKTVSMDAEVYERLKLYAELTGKTIKGAVDYALEDWLDTCGAVEIKSATGIETCPETAPPSVNGPLLVH